MLSYRIDRQRAIVSHSSFQSSLLLLFPLPSECLHPTSASPTSKLSPLASEGECPQQLRGAQEQVSFCKPWHSAQPKGFSVPRAATVLNADIDSESNSTNHSLRVVKNQCTHFFYRSPQPKTCRRRRQQPPGLALALSIPAARACICLYAGQMLRMLLVVIPKPVSMDPLSKDCSELMASRLRFNPSTQASTGKHTELPKQERIERNSLSL